MKLHGNIELAPLTGHGRAHRGHHGHRHDAARERPRSGGGRAFVHRALLREHVPRSAPTRASSASRAPCRIRRRTRPTIPLPAARRRPPTPWRPRSPHPHPCPPPAPRRTPRPARPTKQRSPYETHRLQARRAVRRLVHQPHGRVQRREPSRRPPPSSKRCAPDGDAALRVLHGEVRRRAPAGVPRAGSRPSTRPLGRLDPKTCGRLGRHAARQICEFHERQKQQSWFFAREDGAHRGREGDAAGLGGHLRARRPCALPLLRAHERLACRRGRGGAHRDASRLPRKDGTLDAAYSGGLPHRGRRRKSTRWAARRPSARWPTARSPSSRWTRSPARATPTWRRRRRSCRATWAST